MFQDGFPSNLKDDVSEVVGLIPLKTYNNVSIRISEQTIQYSLDGVAVKFPYRMYCIDVPNEVLNQLKEQDTERIKRFCLENVKFTLRFRDALF